MHVRTQHSTRHFCVAERAHNNNNNIADDDVEEEDDEEEENAAKIRKAVSKSPKLNGIENTKNVDSQNRPVAARLSPALVPFFCTVIVGNADTERDRKKKTNYINDYFIHTNT